MELLAVAAVSFVVERDFLVLEWDIFIGYVIGGHIIVVAFFFE